MICDYGSQYGELLAKRENGKPLIDLIDDSKTVLKAQVIHAVQHEMAQTLSDLVFRRVGLGITGNPGDMCLKSCARIMSDQLQWSSSKRQLELAETKGVFSPKEMAAVEN